jgi:adenylate cyclase
MPDIFISYSSKDRVQADQLIELLGSAGLSVWIDKSGIEAATSWSKEIVQAINECKAFVVLLSPNSLLSNNVIKEVSLASEKRKKILPLDLEPVQLTEDFEYQLAGLQHASMTNIDAVIRALGKLGLEATQAPSLKLVKETDSKKSLMILPFEDLSPTGDNQWFADGLAAELIAALSPIKALRVADQQATKDYKKYQGSLPNYAKEMSIRYFVQGSVRKFGDQIKIAVTLLDIESGDHLWQDSMKGTMNDVFDMQEKVAEKVVEGLKVHLASDEKKKLAERGTENAEAYELFIRASEYYERQTKEGYQLAIQLFTEAIKLDPGYAVAYQYKAHSLAFLYRSYIRDPALLEEGIDLLMHALRMKPDFWGAFRPLSFIYQLQGKFDRAEQAAKDYIQNAPEDWGAHFALGFFYYAAGQDTKAIAPYEQSMKLNPENLTALYNLVQSCNGANVVEKQKSWANVAIPRFERYLKLFPDSEYSKVRRAAMLFWAGRVGEAREATRLLENIKDAFSLLNLAFLHRYLGDYEEALGTLKKAIEAGYRDVKYLITFIGNNNLAAALNGTPEYDEVKKRVVEIADEGDGSEFLPGSDLYNLSCLHLNCDHLDRGMELFRRSIERGFQNPELFRTDPDLDPLREREDFKALMAQLEEPMLP